jgi:Winged helix DNA-binding domain
VNTKRTPVTLTDHEEDTVPAEVLTRRALNRALLARQSLLGRQPPPANPATRKAPAAPTKPAAPTSSTSPTDQALAMVEHLVGLQAQAPFPPYYGLLARLEGFKPEHLAELLTSHAVVRIALMRGTIHLVTADDALWLRPLIQPVLDRALASNFAKRLPGVDLAAVAAAGQTLTTEDPLTFAELGELLTQDWPGQPADALAQVVRARVPLVQVPPRAVWGQSGLARHTPIDVWLGRPLAARPSLELMVERYLAAFGPATVQDVQAWSGLTRLREIVDPMRDRLRVFADEQGRELFDLPDGPRPGPDTPAPARLLAEYDNLILSHDDRTRIMSDQDRRDLFQYLNVFPGSVLLDGFVAGLWRLKRAKHKATVTIELFRSRLPARDENEIAAEANRLLAVTAPATAHEVRVITAGP